MQRKPHKRFFIKSIENQNRIKVSSHCHIRPLRHFFSHWLEIDLTNNLISLNVYFVVEEYFIDYADDHHSFSEALAV